ncbi:hypothetical protein BJF78_00530 [Pseudonocardia sp. CNS-139]|nr:hypothetical protein BJF78_00530 [Pseudonocardia sp. CNS-139]
MRRDALVEVLRSSSGASASLESLVAMGDEPARAEHVRAAAGKDVRILDALCAAAALEPGLLGAAAAASAR